MTKAFFDLRKNYGFRWNLSLGHVLNCLLNYGADEAAIFDAKFYQKHLEKHIEVGAGLLSLLLEMSFDFCSAGGEKERPESSQEIPASPPGRLPEAQTLRGRDRGGDRQSGKLQVLSGQVH